MKSFIITASLLLLILLALFWKSMAPDQTLFSNDGPLGAAVAAQARPPGTGLGVWQCNNWLGEQCPTHMGVSFGLRVLFCLPNCRDWDESDWLGAIYGMLTLLFPMLIIGGSVYREHKGLGPL